MAELELCFCQSWDLWSWLWAIWTWHWIPHKMPWGGKVRQHPRRSVWRRGQELSLIKKLSVPTTADDAWKKLLEVSNSREVDIGSTAWPWQCTEFCDVFVWPDILFSYSLWLVHCRQIRSLGLRTSTSCGTDGDMMLQVLDRQFGHSKKQRDAHVCLFSQKDWWKLGSLQFQTTTSGHVMPHPQAKCSLCVAGPLLHAWFPLGESGTLPLQQASSSAPADKTWSELLSPVTGSLLGVFRKTIKWSTHWKSHRNLPTSLCRQGLHLSSALPSQWLWRAMMPCAVRRPAQVKWEGTNTGYRESGCREDVERWKIVYLHPKVSWYKSISIGDSFVCYAVAFEFRCGVQKMEMESCADLMLMLPSWILTTLWGILRLGEKTWNLGNSAFVVSPKLNLIGLVLRNSDSAGFCV